MSDSSPFDVAVIGAGPGGYVAAIRASQLGLKTVVIEREDRFGGTCTLRGCIPTKALLRDAHLFDEVKKAAAQGALKLGEVAYDFAKIQERKRDIVGKSSKGVDYLLRKNKVTVMKGVARLTAPNRLRVTGDAGVTEVAANAVIVATGSEAKSLPGYNVDEKRIVTNVGALDLTAIPGSIVIVGAGAVGVEFASIFRSFGAKVTLLEALPGLVPLEDEEVSKELQRVFGKKGIEIHTKARLESAKPTDNGVEVTFQTDKGEAKTVMADMMLMATGRAPNTVDLGLNELGVALERGFIKIDRFMETSVKGVYAVGDCVPTPLLAHVASREGIVAVEKIAGKNPVPIDYNRVPNCTYCDPQIASVGLTETKAREGGRAVKTGKFPFMAVAKARIEDATDGFVKIVADAEYGEILGVHMIGGGVTEILAEGVAAMNLESTVEDMVRTIHAHPTLSEGIQEALEAVFGAAIHI